MKKDIHPKYNKKAKITCSCGNVFEVGSTENELHVDVCSACHPLYTGAHRFVDTAGRVDKFKAKLEKAQEYKKNSTKKKERKNNQKKEDK